MQLGPVRFEIQIWTLLRDCRPVLANIPERSPLSQIVRILKAEMVAEALPHIRQFQGKVIVIEHCGHAMRKERIKNRVSRAT